MYEESQIVPYTCEQMFGLVADIERYPEFVPGYRAARVTHRNGDRIEASQRVGLGALTADFISVARCERPRHIEVRSRDFPFDALVIHWQFDPDGTGCRVTFRADLRLGELAARVFGPWLDYLGQQLPTAFVHRAQELYGPRGA